MDVIYDEERYLEFFDRALSDVSNIKPESGHQAEERVIELFDQISLQEFWDYAKEWHSEPNCCVIVFKNLQKLTEETFSAIGRASIEYPEVVIHFIIEDSIKNSLMTGGELVAKLFLLEETNTKLADHGFRSLRITVDPRSFQVGDLEGSPCSVHQLIYQPGRSFFILTSSLPNNSQLLFAICLLPFHGPTHQTSAPTKTASACTPDTPDGRVMP